MERIDEINPVNHTVLLNVFIIFSKRYRVCLHSNLVVWEKENSSTGKKKKAFQLNFIAQQKLMSVTSELTNHSKL